MEVKSVETVFPQEVDSTVNKEAAPVLLLNQLAEQALGALAAHADHDAQPLQAPLQAGSDAVTT